MNQRQGRPGLTRRRNGVFESSPEERQGYPNKTKSWINPWRRHVCPQCNVGFARLDVFVAHWTSHKKLQGRNESCTRKSITPLPRAVRCNVYSKAHGILWKCRWCFLKSTSNESSKFHPQRSFMEGGVKCPKCLKSVTSLRIHLDIKCIRRRNALKILSKSKGVVLKGAQVEEQCDHSVLSNSGMFIEQPVNGSSIPGCQVLGGRWHDQFLIKSQMFADQMTKICSAWLQA